MGKNFEYKPALVQETRNEITYVTSLVSTYSNKFSTSPTTLFASLSPKLQAKCSGAVFTKMNSFGNTMNDISNVGKFIDESEAKIIRELISNGQFESQLSEWISNNEVGTDQLISIGKLYYDSIYELYGNNYKKGLRQVLYPYTALIEAGLSEDIVANIGNGFLQDLANKDLMYTKEGVVYAHKAFTGLMAMFGLRLGYKMVTVNYFDNDQFYLGDKEHQLNATVCTSYVQFLYRCAGLDAVSTDSGATPSNLWSCYGAVYNNDGTIDYRRTFASEYSKGNPKYVSGDAGDVLFNGTHVMMVMENTGEGYIVAENGGGAQTSYYTYGKLASMGYSISDMSSMFDNTSIIYNTPSLHDTYIKTVPNQGRYGANLFITPQTYADKFDVPKETLQKISEQFNSRNRNGIVSPVDTPTQKEPTTLPYTPTQEQPTTISVPPTTSKPTTPTTPSTPTTPTTPSTPTTPTTPTTPSTPTTPTTPSTPTTPTTPIQLKNILPDNKFSNIIPALTDGELGAMEINDSFVSYEVNNIGSKTYDDYIKLIEENGYHFNESGVWTKDNYTITLMRTSSNDSLKLVLNTIDMI